MTRDETFVNLEEWFKEIKQHASQDVTVYLVGNKADHQDRKEITFERATEFAKRNGIHKCFETSAKTGKSVEETFSCSAKDILAKVKRELKATDGKQLPKSSSPS